MNKTALVFALTTALLSPLYAVDVIDETRVGTDGLPGGEALFVTPFQPGPHTISGSDLTGGDGGTVTNATDTADAYGGAGGRFALLAPGNKEIYVGSSSLQGGQGGDVTIDGVLTSAADAYGGNGFLTTQGRLYSTNSQFYGGDGGSVVATGGAFIANVTGGNGIEIRQGLLELDNGSAVGGQGGDVTTSGTPLSTADGGNGVSLITSTFSNSVFNSTLLGGDGGTADNGSGLASANGGIGFKAEAISGPLVISDSIVRGGDAGTVNGAAGSTANGGLGLLLINADDVTIINSTLSGGINTNTQERAASFVMEGSTVDLMGGTLNGDVVFSGTNTTTISIVDTAINGAFRQTGGTVNVNAWEDDHFGDTVISDGTMNFTGQDFSLTSFTLESSTSAVNFSDNVDININGALDVGAGSVVVASNVVAANNVTLTVGTGSLDVGLDLSAGASAILEVGGGSLDVGGAVTLNTGSALTVGTGSATIGSDLSAGSGTALAVGGGSLDVGGVVTLNAGSALTVGNGSLDVGSDLLAGTGTTLAVGGGSVDVGGFLTLNTGSALTIGTGSFEAQGNAVFATDNALSVGSGSFDAGGNMTFDSGTTLNLGSGAVGAGGNITFDAGTTLNIGTGSVVGGGDATIGSGVTLDIGTGSVEAGGNLSIGSGNTNYVDFDGSKVGTFSAVNDLTIGSNVTWKIDAGNVLVTNNTGFRIASADGILTHQVTIDDIELMGSEVILGWLADIQAIEDTGGDLKAVYIQDEIDYALGVEGETSTEYGKAMADLALLVPAGSDEYVEFANLTNSQAATAELMTNTYLRATEMASSLVRLQSIFADQINDRTRSRLRQNEVGYPSASSMPAGSAGWDAMREYSDRVEDRYGYDEVMSSVDAAVPDVSYDDMTDSVGKALPTVSYDDMKDSLDQAVPAVKTEKIVLPPSYQIWGRGYGSYNEQNTVDDFEGYEAFVGGGILGLDKEIDNMLVGIAGGYARTDLDGYAGKDGTSDTGHASVYFSTHGDHAFLDANATYAYNGVDTEYKRLSYSGEYTAHTMGFYLGGGYAFPITKNVLLTPEASILSALYSRDDYAETSDIYPTLKWDSYDQWSHVGSLGGTLNMIQSVEFMNAEVAVQPEVRVHLLHEFNNEFDNETYNMVGGDYTVGASLKPREENLIKVGAGIRLSKWSSDNTDFGFDFDGIYGDNFSSYIISGKLMHRF